MLNLDVVRALVFLPGQQCRENKEETDRLRMCIVEKKMYMRDRAGNESGKPLRALCVSE